jgi:hypothetical protein
MDASDAQKYFPHFHHFTLKTIYSLREREREREGERVIFLNSSLF